MSEETQTRTEGKFDELKGNVKEATGRATGDRRTEAEGKIDKAKGSAKQAAADAKEKVDDVVKDVTDR